MTYKLSVVENIADKTFTDLYGENLDNRVIFGNSDAPTEFQAHVKMEFWGEDTVTLFEPGVKGEAKLVDDIIELALPDRKLQWHQRREAQSEVVGFEKWRSIVCWDVEFASKPASNKYTLRLGGGWNDFYWCRQKPLAEMFGYADIEEYIEEDGTIWLRPAAWQTMPEHSACLQSMDGGYTVYHKTKCNDYSKLGGRNYRTGKVGSIYRPRLIDADGKEAWCDIRIEADVIEITMPEKFLDTAAYPVLLDPEFGYHTVADAYDTSIAEYVYVSGLYTASGTGDSMTVYTKQTAGGGFTSGIYDDTTGEPDNVLGDCVEGTCPSVPAWADSENFNSPPTLEADMWIGYYAPAIIRWYRDTGHPTINSKRFNPGSYSAGTLPAWGSTISNYSGYVASQYVTYTPTAAGNAGIMTTNTGYWGAI